MRYTFLFTLLIMSLTSFTQKVTIIPEPVYIEMSKGNFKLNNKTIIVAVDNEDKRIAGLLNEYLYSFYKFKIPVKAAAIGNVVQIGTKKFIKAPDRDAYQITVSANRIFISGDTYEGTFYGIQSFLQLLPTKISPINKGILIPQLHINDYPRYNYRGMHLDVARHFFPVPFIKKYIDYLAFHKMNNFHWHLTDDQGWRIEIKKYPLLTKVGGYRNGTIIGRYPGKANDSLCYGGFYTQAQIKEVVKYARERFINIVPEIDIPGHSSAAIAAYPQLSCFPDESTKISDTTLWAGNRNGKQVQQTWGVFEDILCPTKYTFNFINNVLDEVMEMFPSQIIHIGGDEAPKENWKRSVFCQRLMIEKGLPNEHSLQAYFIQRVADHVKSKGRDIIGWDEIIEDSLSSDVMVMNWRGDNAGIKAIEQKHKTIVSPESHVYFDWAQKKMDDTLTRGNFTPVEKVYSFEPFSGNLSEEQLKYLYGGEGCVWSEYMTNNRKVGYMLFPRMSALAEVLWTPKEKKDWNVFENKLPYLFDRYKLWKANFSTAFYDLQSSILPATDNQGVLWKLETKNKQSKIIYVKGRTANGSYSYTTPVNIKHAGEYGATLTDKNDKIISGWLWQKFSFNKATGKNIILKDPPWANYSGSGAFTLVNGIITENRLLQSSEWLGFTGKDLDATIDLSNSEIINSITLNYLDQKGSWIYPPAAVEFFASDDGQIFKSIGKLQPDAEGHWGNERKIKLSLTTPINSRFIKIIATRFGKIPSGNPGAGSAASLFADEIEIE